MFVTCVTSRYLPNLRYLARLCEVDCAVVLDLAPLPHQNKNSFVTRNRICDRSGKVNWLSVPIQRRGIKCVKDAKIDKTNHSWVDKHVKSISHAYPDHPKVSGDFLKRLKDILSTTDGTLIDLNMRTLELILKYIGLENKYLVRQSTLFDTHTKNHRHEVVNLLGATAYVAGQVEWEVMQKSGSIEEMNKLGTHIIKSQELDQESFPSSIVRDRSCIHALCSLGPEKTRDLVNSMVKSLIQLRFHD